MNELIQPFERIEHDLTGSASLDFRDDSAKKLMEMVVPGVDLSRFELAAVKLYVAGRKPVLTIYALVHSENTSNPAIETPVRKFKVPISWTQLFEYVRSFDLVVHNGIINMEEMKVDRK